MNSPPRDQLLDELKAKFDAHGLSVTDWAIQHGFKRESVYAVLAGRSRCRRGEAHRVAVALGLKVPMGEFGNLVDAFSEFRGATTFPSDASAQESGRPKNCEGAMT